MSNGAPPDHQRPLFVGHPFRRSTAFLRSRNRFYRASTKIACGQTAGTLTRNGRFWPDETPAAAEVSVVPLVCSIDPAASCTDTQCRFILRSFA